MQTYFFDYVPSRRCFWWRRKTRGVVLSPNHPRRLGHTIYSYAGYGPLWRQCGETTL